MKRLLPVSILLLVSFCFSASTIASDSGVSRELAADRKGKVKNIVYDIALTIDSLAEIKPEGKISIKFDYERDDGPLLLDFVGESVKSLTVNDIDISNPEFREGHIAVPSSRLISGANKVEVEFISADRALNRNPEYMYTLFVPHRAHSVFPCFDQPDMKAGYNLSLTLPAEWQAVSNSPVVAVEDASEGRRIFKFGTTEPLSTYLFAFAAGKFDYCTHTDGNRTIGAYYRENDPRRLSQLDEIFKQVENSLKIMEDYTGIKYPFAKYDLVILPGFQFGGMEHTGATFYNDGAIFLSENATGENHLRRAQLISHETSHMWFGDYVTMQWFDDVWTKEVFANYFAAFITRQLLPEYDHDLEWLRVYMTPALEQDRSDGSTPIRQELDNMNNAGLIYNNIIYNKSPLMMKKLAEITGEENFRKGVRKYLNDHPYGNACWDDLIEALSAFTDADLEQFSRVWVYEPGMPRIEFSAGDGLLTVKQVDDRGRGIVWPQTFDVLLCDGKTTEMLTVSFDGSTPVVELPTALEGEDIAILPSADGRAYGLLSLESERLKTIMTDSLNEAGIVASLTPTGRLATLMMLNENYLDGRISSNDWADYLIRMINATSDSQTLSALAAYMAPALLDLQAEEAGEYESRLLNTINSHTSQQGKTVVLKSLIPVARAPRTAGALYEIWGKRGDGLLGEDDLSTLALNLAIALPEKAGEIIAVQRERLTSDDRIRKFDFLSRAAVTDEEVLDNLFESLKKEENRLIEPWTVSLLSLLNHPLRHSRSVKYITPALDLLSEVRRTGDIFFPANWASALLASYREKEARALVEQFLQENSCMNPLLLNKILQAAARLRTKTY